MTASCTVASPIKWLTAVALQHPDVKVLSLGSTAPLRRGYFWHSERTRSTLRRRLPSTPPRWKSPVKRRLPLDHTTRRECSGALPCHGKAGFGDLGGSRFKGSGTCRALHARVCPNQLAGKLGRHGVRCMSDNPYKERDTSWWQLITTSSAAQSRNSRTTPSRPSNQPAHLMPTAWCVSWTQRMTWTMSGSPAESLSPMN